MVDDEIGFMLLIRYCFDLSLFAFTSMYVVSHYSRNASIVCSSVNYYVVVHSLVFNAISGKSPGESLERKITVAICCFIDKTKSLSFFSSLPH